MSTSRQPLIAILGGPSLDRIGVREPEIYGNTTWAELEELCKKWGKNLGFEVEFDQEDSEGALVRLIHQAGERCAGLIINAAAYTHTSVALRDALAALDIPIVEVHLTNPSAREEFRRTNFLAGVVTAGVFGFGCQGYHLALEGMVEILKP